MAQDKKSFVLYSDNYGLIKQLPDEIAGRLFKHIFAYVNDENPISDDLLLNVAFEPIKTALKRDLKKYEKIKEKRSLAGKKSAEQRQQNSTNSTHVDFVQQTPTNSTVSVSDSVSVSVSDSDILLEKESKGFDLSADKSAEVISNKKEETSLLVRPENQRKKVAPKKESFWETWIDTWFTYYELKFGNKPTFNAAQGKHLKTIAKNCRIMSQEKANEVNKEFVWDENRVRVVFTRFLDKAYEDNWLRSHFLLKNLESNFDAITNRTANETRINNYPALNSGPGYKAANVDIRRVVQELESDAENGNIPGQYS